MQQTQDLHVVASEPLLTPAELKTAMPMSEAAVQTVVQTRNAIKKILLRKDPRMLLVVGPCSIHNKDLALDYAKRLQALSEEVGDKFLIIMRVYFEKPRTTVGWKGLINDPHLDGQTDIAHGLRLAREILNEIAHLGMGAATEFLDPFVPQYIADQVSWAAIGARTTESQTHREMSSGLSMPVGFKNNTDGNLHVAVNAMKSCKAMHSFLGITQEGQAAIIKTTGNKWSHVILRGGKGQPNYDPVSVREAIATLESAGVSPMVMIDCSHENSNKKPELQPVVLESVIEQRIDGTEGIIGAMIESNIEAGNQKVGDDPASLQYGVSITDPCIDWPTTERIIRDAHKKLGETLTAKASA